MELIAHVDGRIDANSLDAFITAYQSVNINLLEQDLRKNLKEALIEIQASKAREGEKLQEILLDKLKNIEMLIDEAKKILPVLIKGVSCSRALSWTYFYIGHITNRICLENLNEI